MSTHAIKVKVGTALTVSAIALALIPAAVGATDEGLLVIHGSPRSSSLELGVKSDHLVMKGLPARKQAGCRFSVRRKVTTCALEGKTSIELRMGPENDFVRVVQGLPLPLTVLLGPGSDKFIGNAERDRCIPGGDRRNRCVGGAGNDICIAGPRNTDCVGGPGNDYCETSSGSDGCWGGPGRDVCRMGPGNDGCHGGEGNDRLYGGSDHDRLYGGGGYDYCDGGAGRGRTNGCDVVPRP